MTGHFGPNRTDNRLDIDNRTSKWAARKTECGRTSNQEVKGLLSELTDNNTIKMIIDQNLAFFYRTINFKSWTVQFAYPKVSDIKRPVSVNDRSL